MNEPRGGVFAGLHDHRKVIARTIVNSVRSIVFCKCGHSRTLRILAPNRIARTLSAGTALAWLAVLPHR